MTNRTIRIIISAIVALLPVVTGAKTDNRSFRIISAANGLADNSAQTIDCTFSGRIIVSSIGRINIYDGGYFQQISDSGESVYPLKGYRGNYHLYFDGDHHLWLKDKRKVKCVDLMTERYMSDLKPLFMKEGVDGDVDDLFVDSSGRLWLVANGILTAEKKKYRIKLRQGKELQDIDLDGDVLMLFYHDGSMDCYNFKSCKFLYTSFAYDKECQEIYSASTVLLRTQEGLFQIRNGANKSILMWYDFSKKLWTEIMRQNYSLNNLVIKDGVLYVACAYGYWTYDMKTHNLEHFDEVLLENGRILLTDINSMEFDRQGGMWLGTENRGLLYSKPRISPFSVYTWENPKALEFSALMDKAIDTSGYVYESGVYCRFTDSRGWRWKGGRDGIAYIRPGDTEETYIDNSIGLLNHVAHCIVEDLDHNIWLGTSCGISVIIIKDGEIKYAISFDSNDNVPIEMFANGRAVLLPNGNIVMQAIDHVLEFRPKTFITSDDNFILLHPKFVRLMVNGTVVDAGTEINGKVIIKDAVSRTHLLELGYLENTVTLTFSALNFFRPLQTYYKVRVLGRSDEWQVMSYFNSNGLVDAKGLLHLPLMGLEPGNYTVEVQASMFPDKWVTPPLKIRISVKQPWWQTTGLYIVLFVVLGVLVVINILLYNRNNKLRIKCNLGEFELTRLLYNFLKRCDACKDEIQSPTCEEIYGNSEESVGDLNDKFIDVLLDLRPYLEKEAVNHNVYKEVSARNGINILEFYDLVSANANKSPRLFNRAMWLNVSAQMLRDTDESIEVIAEKCRFASANYFSGCFLKRFRLTPKEYRERR
ncbi:MAG: helix-turn-helix domain-containing protein [Prevotella sp.]